MPRRPRRTAAARIIVASTETPAAINSSIAMTPADVAGIPTSTFGRATSAQTSAASARIPSASPARRGSTSSETYPSQRRLASKVKRTRSQASWTSRTASRRAIVSGRPSPAARSAHGIRGVSFDQSTFERALRGATDYDEQIARGRRFAEASARSRRSKGSGRTRGGAAAATDPYGRHAQSDPRSHRRDRRDRARRTALQGSGPTDRLRTRATRCVSAARRCDRSRDPTRRCLRHGCGSPPPGRPRPRPGPGPRCRAAARDCGWRGRR